MVEKKIKGLKIHILTDTNGFLLKVVVHKANIHDSKGAKIVLKDILESNPNLKVVFGDGGYNGLSDWAAEDSSGNLRIEVVKRFDSLKVPVDHPFQQLLFDDQPVIHSPIKMNNNDGNFPVLKWRWIVERTLAWLSMNRRLSKIYERNPKTVEHYCYIASSRLMLKRLATQEYG